MFAVNLIFISVYFYLGASNLSEFKRVEDEYEKLQQFFKHYKGGAWKLRILRKWIYDLACWVEDFRDKVNECNPEAIWYANYISEELVRLGNEIEDAEVKGLIDFEDARVLATMRYDLWEQLQHLISDFKDKCICSK